MSVSISMGSVQLNKPLAGKMLKSTQEKMERRQECDNKVAFYENRISMLKDMKTNSLEDISRKLELFHSYKDAIDATKQEYNNQQMFHVMDEAREMGEKIAKAAEKMKLKSAEERKEDEIKEALGTEEKKGLLAESLEKITELAEENEKMTDSIEEITELTEKMREEDLEKAKEEGLEEIKEPEEIPAGDEKDISLVQPVRVMYETFDEMDKAGYKSVDYYI